MAMGLFPVNLGQIITTSGLATGTVFATHPEMVKFWGAQRGENGACLVNFCHTVILLLLLVLLLLWAMRE